MRGRWLHHGEGPVRVPVATGPPWQTCTGQTGSCGGSEGAAGSTGQGLGSWRVPGGAGE